MRAVACRARDLATSTEATTSATRVKRVVILLKKVDEGRLCIVNLTLDGRGRTIGQTNRYSLHGLLINRDPSPISML
jgi:hypothetical protein